MKALIIGASGQVGRALADACTAAGTPWLGTACREPRRDLITLDLRDAAAVRDLIAVYRPTVVFLTAAMTHVDRAELHPDECRAINVGGPQTVALGARQVGARLVFFSTDHVFAECDRPMHEDDPTRPLSAYAESKVLAERRVREILPQSHLVLRTSWVFGPDEQGKNFVYRAVRTLRAGEPLVVPADQYGQPTYGPDLAAAALALAKSGATGTFHAVGPTRLTRLDHARLIARVFGLNADRIDGRPTAELRQPAPRPLSVWLADDKLRQALGAQPIRPPAAALAAMRDTMLRDVAPQSEVA